MDPRSNGPDYSTLPSSDAIVLTVPVHHPKPRNSSASAVVLAAFLAVLLLVSFVALVPPSPTKEVLRSIETEREVPAIVFAPRGVREGVSGKSSGLLRAGYTWTNEMLQWQRSTFHFQPQQNWMNDPNGPVFYNGYYHLFYQYNPDSAVWGNITWGHALSRDLINWFHLPLAMVPDKWYDINGVWSGSATILPDGRLIVLYTGSTNASVQVQNLAVPADPADPLLLNWVKSPANPILTPPPGIGIKDFRDPTTAWYVESESTWRIAIGSKDADHNGLVLVYATKDFVEYERLPGAMHVVLGIGMWECVDFFPVAVDGEEGLDTSANGPGVKHVLKGSLDDDKHDYYAIGSYDVESNKWTPDDVEADVGLGWRLDYGKYYASKTFYDQVKKRRVLWGWTGETDSEQADILKGWASLQTIPRTVTFDAKTGSNLLQWPVEEVNSLRKSEVALHNITIPTGSVLPLKVREATQLDIEAEFELDKEALEQIFEADVGYNCSTSGGAAGRGALGPFGLLVLANEKLSEQTAVYFYVAKGTDGNLNTFICQDELRSSKANDLVKRVYGSIVPVLHGEKLSVRVMIDRSIVETFAQGGRTCITSRVYPTTAIYSAARLFLFNNATGTHVKATSVKMWEMESASIKPYDFTRDANMHSVRAQ